MCCMQVPYPWKLLVEEESCLSTVVRSRQQFLLEVRRKKSFLKVVYLFIYCCVKLYSKRNETIKFVLNLIFNKRALVVEIMG